MDPALALIGAAWLAIGAMLLWGVARGLRTLFFNSSELPLFEALARAGFTPAQFERAIGMDAFARAVRRCTHCPGRAGCRGPGDYCPNQPLFQLARARRT